MRIIFGLLFLTACSSQIPAAVPVTVKVPVAVSCHSEMVAEPDWNIRHLDPSANSLDQLKAALADLDLSKGYAEELRAQLEACL